MFDLSIIILNYNTKNLLSNLLTSISKSRLEKLKLEVIIVDNASDDGSQELVKSKFPKFKLIENTKNLGFSKGNNRGIKKAQGKYLLFLNSDTVVLKDTILKTYKFLKSNKKFSAVTCKVELVNGKIDPACHRGFPTPWAALSYFLGLEKLFPKSKLLAQYHQGWKDLAKPHEVDAISGAFLLIRKNILEKVNNFDEDYFIYGEDLDLCFKLRKKGYRIGYFPGTKIIHYKKQSGREKSNGKKVTQNDEIIKEETSKHFYETMKIFYNKHYKHKYPWFIKAFVLAGVLLVSKFKK
ncbi:glycosyltransferase family 2 protein [Patescibacteria group bacterium]